MRERERDGKRYELDHICSGSVHFPQACQAPGSAQADELFISHSEITACHATQPPVVIVLHSKPGGALSLFHLRAETWLCMHAKPSVSLISLDANAGSLLGQLVIQH